MISKKSPDNPDRSQSLISTRRSERSFSLVETVVAVALIAFLMIEVSGVHGNAINFAEYSRKALQATYLAKRLMSQVEYQASWRTPLKEMAANEKDKPFEDDPEFSYSLSIEPLPNAIELMFKIMSGGLVGGGGKGEGEDDKQGVGAMLEQIKGMVETAVGEEPIWLAKVSVSWPEGARRNSVDLAMIITDIKKIETSLGPLLAKAPQPPAATTPPAALPQNNQPGGGGSDELSPPPAPPPL